MAQVLPGAAEPGRMQQQKEPEAVKPDVEVVPPSVQPGIPEAPKGAAEIHFILKEVQVDGSTVYRQDVLRKHYDHLLGKPVSLLDVYRVAEDLTLMYRKDGYILSRVVVPEQSIDRGVVRLQVLEGYVSRVNFTAGPGLEHLKKGKTLLRMGERLKAIRPLTLSGLERTLLLMNDLPGMSARAVIRPSPDTPNAAELDVVLDRKRVRGSIRMDNRGSRYLGPGQVLGALNVNQVFDETDSIGLRAATSYQTREMVFGEVSYQRQLSSNGLNLRVRANTGRTRPGASLKPFEVEGRDSLVEARLSYPMVRSRAGNLDVYGSLDWHNVSSDVLQTRLSKDKIRSARVGGNWSSVDHLLGSNALNFQLSRGLDVMGASDKGDLTSRPDAKAGYTKVEMTASREQFFRGSDFSVMGMVGGQYAFTPLLASEEFGLGGEAFGSAYDSSELTGDSGIAARIEPRYRVGTGWSRGALTSLQPYLFYDVGMVHNRDPYVGQNSRQSLASAGGGVRLVSWGGVQGSFEVAKPLTRGVAALNDDKDPRFFFRVGKSF